MWQHLKEIALIGTDKKVLDEDLLPEQIKNLMTGSHLTSAEEKFLQTCSYATFYQEAGEQYSLIGHDIDLPIIKESLQVGEKEILQLLFEIENLDQTVKESLLNFWLDTLIENHWIINADTILKILKMTNGFSKDTKRKVVNVIGEKGKWILSIDTTYQFPLLKEDSMVWEEGRLEERKAYFEEKRKYQNEDTLSLLMSTWKTESIAAKKGFLGIISETYQQSDKEELTLLYQKEFSYKTKEKKGEREARELIVATLLGDTTSELYQQTTTQVSKYFGTKKRSGMLGLVGADQVVINLPEEPDDFFTVDIMEQRYGIDPKNYDIGLFEDPKLYWLSLFLTWIPFHFWAGFFKKGYKEALWYFLGESDFKIKVEGKLKPIFREALVQSAKKHKDKELATQLISELEMEHSFELFSLLEKETFESYAIRKKWLADANLLAAGPLDNHEYWSPAFSKELIMNTYGIIETTYYNVLQQLAKLAAIHLAPESEEVLDKYNEKAKGSKDHKLWDKHFYQLVKNSLKIKKILNH